MSSQTKIKLNMDALKSRREWRRHKVKDGHNIFRILPPFGESSNGYPYRKYSLIWGLTDPQTQRARPFASSLVNEKACPVYEYVQALKKKAETIKAKMQASGKSENDIKERLTSLNKLISDLNPKTIYIYNAADKAGEVGLLELKSTAHKKMKTEMTEYISTYNQDPTSLNSDPSDSGVWFDVVRTGQFRDTEYDVKVVKTKKKDPTTGKVSFEDDQTPLPDSIVENYDNLAYDLSSVYKTNTYQELEAILAANMDALIEICPDADISSDTTDEVVVEKKAAPVKPSVKTNIRLDDEDDMEEEEVRPSSTKSTSKSASSDDLLAEYDALLNS